MFILCSRSVRFPHRTSRRTPAKSCARRAYLNSICAASSSSSGGGNCVSSPRSSSAPSPSILSSSDSSRLSFTNGPHWDGSSLFRYPSTYLENAVSLSQYPEFGTSFFDTFLPCPELTSIHRRSILHCVRQQRTSIRIRPGIHPLQGSAFETLEIESICVR